jgi:hypothetical protein
MLARLRRAVRGRRWPASGGPDRREREQRRAQDRERLNAPAEQLLTSEGRQRWARVRAQGSLARLSLNNQLLVVLARPDATLVAGFKAWLRLGYCVRKGEKAIRIVAPMPIKDRDSDSDDASETCVFFKGISVFDRRQVAPIDGIEQASLEPPCEPLTGDSHAWLLEPLAAFARSLGFEVKLRVDRRLRGRVVPPVGGAAAITLLG